MKKYESLKKVELHVHLDGSLNPERVSRWTRKDLREVEKLLILESKGDLEHYLEMFSYPISLLQTKTRLIDASEQLCIDLMNDGVIYAEIRFDPIAHLEKGLTIEEVVEYVLEGMKKTSLKCNLILCMKREREFEDNKKVIDVAKKFIKKGVVAIDLAGNEALYPLRNFKELFDYASEKDIPYVIHAGEAGDASEIKTAISYGATRIGHGVSAIKNFDVMEILKKKSIPLEICVTSNMALNLYGKYDEHPIARLIDSGVPVTINTDNRTVVGTTLTDEYNILNRHFGLNIVDFNRMNKCAIEHSFLSDDEKKELIKEFM